MLDRRRALHIGLAAIGSLSSLPRGVLAQQRKPSHGLHGDRQVHPG
jgi:hypothetical protein